MMRFPAIFKERDLAGGGGPRPAEPPVEGGRPSDVGELVQLGLHVSILWQAAGQQQPGDQQPGTVTSVRPGGQVAVGSTVYLTAAPPKSAHGHGNRHGGDGNRGGANGGGG
jgi:hypothetical protein